MTPWIIALCLGLIASVPVTAIGLMPLLRQRTMDNMKWLLPLSLLLPVFFNLELTGLYIQSTMTKLFLCTVFLNMLIATTYVNTKRYNPWLCPCEPCQAGRYTHANTCEASKTRPNRYLGRWLIRRRHTRLAYVLLFVITAWSSLPDGYAIAPPWALIAPWCIFLHLRFSTHERNESPPEASLRTVPTEN